MDKKLTLRQRADSEAGVSKWTIIKQYNAWWIFAPASLGDRSVEFDACRKSHQEALEYVMCMIFTEEQ